MPSDLVMMMMITGSHHLLCEYYSRSAFSNYLCACHVVFYCRVYEGFIIKSRKLADRQSLLRIGGAMNRPEIIMIHFDICILSCRFW